MEMKTHHWVGLIIVAVIAYYAGTNHWLGMITSKVGAAG